MWLQPYKRSLLFHRRKQQCHTKIDPPSRRVNNVNNMMTTVLGQRERERQQGYQPSWHHQDVIYLCSTGHWDTSSCLSGRDWQPSTEQDTTCGIVSEVGHAESWWEADCVRRILGKDCQPLMTHDSTETWHSHAQFHHLTQLPCPQTGYNKWMVTHEPHSTRWMPFT